MARARNAEGTGKAYRCHVGIDALGDVIDDSIVCGVGRVKARSSDGGETAYERKVDSKLG